MSRALVIAGIVAGVLILIALGATTFLLRGPDLRAYEPLRNPRIGELPGTKVIEVPFSGDPNIVIGKAFGVLMRTYFSTPGVKIGLDRSSPEARYEKLGDKEFAAEITAGERDKLKKETWTGVAAIAVPDSVTHIKAVAADGMKAHLGRRDYCTVAAILHVGSYETEWPQIDRLTKFITEQGYEICGPHEEVYLRGPGTLFVKPADYYTIIRYQVRKKGP